MVDLSRFFGNKATSVVNHEIDFYLDDTVNSMCQFVSKTAALWDKQNRRPWHLDLSRCRYLGPDAAAMIVAAVEWAKYKGVSHKVTLPQEPAKVAAFCIFSGLQWQLERTRQPRVDHPECETVPVRVIRTTNYRDPDPVIGLVKRHAEISRDEEDYLAAGIRELLQNVEDHANSPFGAVTCARYMAKTSEVRVSVVDFGDGIFRTLSREHPDTTSPSHALQRVIRGGFSAKSRPNNMGCGISNICASVQTSGGRFVAITDNAYASHNRGNWQHVVRNLKFPGTAVFFTLKLENGRRG